LVRRLTFLLQVGDGDFGRRGLPVEAERDAAAAAAQKKEADEGQTTRAGKRRENGHHRGERIGLRGRGAAFAKAALEARRDRVGERVAIGGLRFGRRRGARRRRRCSRRWRRGGRRRRDRGRRGRWRRWGGGRRREQAFHLRRGNPVRRSLRPDHVL